MSFQVNPLTNDLIAIKNATAITAMSVRTEIINVIENYEPRVNLLRVSVNANIDSYNMDVIINYEIVGIDIPPQELSFVLIPTR